MPWLFDRGVDPLILVLAARGGHTRVFQFLVREVGIPLYRGNPDIVAHRASGGRPRTMQQQLAATSKP